MFKLDEDIDKFLYVIFEKDEKKDIFKTIQLIKKKFINYNNSKLKIPKPLNLKLQPLLIIIGFNNN